ncbi:MAG: hypothetical protein ACD_60C00036G0007 [uncultured bacterium]|nr:MAG: hypothetical protein ACD_60C00036G0007 [uncultured bacterium]
MRQIFLFFMMIFLMLGVLINHAEARRFGGGKSFGIQRSVNSYSRIQNANIKPQQGMSSARNWLAPLMGFAVGGLLSYLFMGHGFGSGLFSWILIAGIGLFIWNLLRNKFQPATQSLQGNVFPGSSASYSHDFFTQEEDAPVSLPAGFEASTFLRDAKVQFIRLQAAYDSKNLNDLREFTSPEVFAEIQLQLQERKDEANHTEVVTLNASLIDVSTELDAVIASVYFSGLIRENPLESAALFNETWHFRKDNTKSTWIITGVQQQ